MRDLPRTLRDMRFSDGLERVYPLGVLFPHLHDFAKTPFPDYFEEIESFNGERFISEWFEVNLQVEGAGAGRSCVPLI